MDVVSPEAPPELKIPTNEELIKTYGTGGVNCNCRGTGWLTRLYPIKKKENEKKCGWNRMRTLCQCVINRMGRTEEGRQIIDDINKAIQKLRVASKMSKNLNKKEPE